MFHQISHFTLLPTQWYVPYKNIWCHFKNYFKLGIIRLIVALLAVLKVIVLVLLPDYADGQENVS